MKSGFRHLARQIVVKALFWHSERPKTSTDEIIGYLLENDEGKSLPQTDFAKTTFTGVIAHLEEIDELIATYAPEWPLAQIAKTDLSILRLGVYELLHNDDVPPLVAINEAVELAKEFCDASGSQFINGVLSKLGKDKLGQENLTKSE